MPRAHNRGDPRAAGRDLRSRRLPGPDQQGQRSGDRGAGGVAVAAAGPYRGPAVPGDHPVLAISLGTVHAGPGVPARSQAVICTTSAESLNARFRQARRSLPQRAGRPQGPHRRLGQIEVPGHLPGRPVTSTAPLHDLALNSGVKDRRRARLLPFHGFHGSFFKTITSKLTTRVSAGQAVDHDHVKDV
jgi:hypothetical protein